jgi:hypothetical protein
MGVPKGFLTLEASPFLMAKRNSSLPLPSIAIYKKKLVEQKLSSIAINKKEKK